MIETSGHTAVRLTLSLKGDADVIRMFNRASDCLGIAMIKKEVLRPAAKPLADDIRAHAPIGTGKRSDETPRKHLKDTIRINNGQGSWVEVKVASQAAHLVEYGTRPHEIYPKNAKVLRFPPWKRHWRTVYRRWAKKASARAYPFIRPSIARMKDRILSLTKMNLVKLFERHLSEFRQTGGSAA